MKKSVKKWFNRNIDLFSSAREFLRLEGSDPFNYDSFRTINPEISWYAGINTPDQYKELEGIFRTWTEGDKGKYCGSRDQTIEERRESLIHIIKKTKDSLIITAGTLNPDIFNKDVTDALRSKLDGYDLPVIVGVPNEIMVDENNDNEFLDLLLQYSCDCTVIDYVDMPGFHCVISDMKNVYFDLQHLPHDEKRNSRWCLKSPSSAAYALCGLVNFMHGDSRLAFFDDNFVHSTADEILNK